MSKYGKNSAKVVALNVMTWCIVILIVAIVLGGGFYFGYPKYQKYSLQKYIDSAVQDIHNCYDPDNYTSTDAKVIQQIESSAQNELEKVNSRDEVDQVVGKAIAEIQKIELVDFSEDEDIEFLDWEEDNAEDSVEEMVVEKKPEETKAILLSSTPSVGSRVGISASSSTSVIKQDGVNNNAEMLFDGKDDTSWQEGVNGFGIGESVSASFYGDYNVKYIGFKLGNWKNDKYYYGNAKPRKLRIILGNFAQSIEFTGERREEWVEFTNPIKADSIRFEIEEVYPGTTWEDTCIAEIEIHEE